MSKHYVEIDKVGLYNEGIKYIFIKPHICMIFLVKITCKKHCAILNDLNCPIGYSIDR